MGSSTPCIGDTVFSHHVHRRFADLAQWITWGSDVIPISIDLAIDSHHGNILRDDIWKRLICSRKVTGGHAGPPCETLSFARWLLLEDGQRQQPLRTTQAPWGRDDLSLREVEQVVTGTWKFLIGASKRPRWPKRTLVHLGFCLREASFTGRKHSKDRFPTRPLGETLSETHIAFGRETS